MSSFFDDDVFPKHFDKAKILGQLQDVYNNKPTSTDESSKMARLFALLETVMGGGYDEKYLYIVSGDNDVINSIDLFNHLLTDYAIYYDRLDKKTLIPAKNAEIIFTTYAEVDSGMYDYITAELIVMDLSYHKETESSLNTIHTKIKSCLSFTGGIVGFLTDFSDLPKASGGSGGFGEFRMKDGLLQVFGDNGWINLRPD